MYSNTSTNLLGTVVMIFAFAWLLAAPIAFAAVSTDKDDYSPGETVTITGDGYLAGESVLIVVTAPYGLESGTVLANGSGEFTWSFVLPNNDSALGDYTYTATGQASGVSQSGVFSDGNVKAFPIPTNVTFSLTLTIYDSATCTGAIVDGPDVETGVSDPSGETTGVGNTDSVLMQAAALSDQGTAFIGWTTAAPFVATSTTVVSGDSICVSGNFTGNRSYFANYAPIPTTGTLTLLKDVVNDNGGTAVDTDWTLSANGPTPVSGSEGDASVTNAVVDLGTYDLSETGPADYSSNGVWQCVGGNQTDDATIEIAAGDDVVCTIENNDDAPSLTLQKVVVNDDGGTATTTDWTLTATGPTGFSGAGPIVGNGASFDAGTYDLSESGPAGYNASAWVCAGGTQNDADTVDIGLGESVICTITNDDIAPTEGTLTVTKIVVNDDGGTATTTDFILRVGDGSATTTVSSGVADTFTAGDYVVEESGLSGYTGTIGGDCAADGSLTIVAGQSYACTITNDDQPGTLVVQKILINDNSGVAATTTFAFQVNAGGSQNFEADGENQLSVDAGVYSIVEDAAAGYTTTYSNSENGDANCDSLAVGNGETVTCTITNNDVAPPAPPVSPCAAAPSSGTIKITICNRGTINNTSTADSSTGTNLAGGSTGGTGGAGGGVDPDGNENNGGATAGNGGNGGNAGAGGLVQTGNASADASAANDLNDTRGEIDLGCNCGDINSVTIGVTIDNTRISPAQNTINNVSQARARSGENLAAGSTGGGGGNGGSVNAGIGNENNGGASAGTGGSGGSSDSGGTILTGNASSTARSLNLLNTTRFRVGF